MATKFKSEVFRDGRGLYRWRLVRGKTIVAESGKGYRRPIDVDKALVSLLSELLTGVSTTITPFVAKNPKSALARLAKFLDKEAQQIGQEALGIIIGLRDAQ
jgi:uncharacterized protein YegP (UPF0339 family)